MKEGIIDTCIMTMRLSGGVRLRLSGAVRLSGTVRLKNMRLTKREPQERAVDMRLEKVVKMENL